MDRNQIEDKVLEFAISAFRIPLNKSDLLTPLSELPSDIDSLTVVLFLGDLEENFLEVQFSFENDLKAKHPTNLASLVDIIESKYLIKNSNNLSNKIGA